MASCCIYLSKISFILLVITVTQLEGYEQRAFIKPTNSYQKTTPPVIPVNYNSPQPYTDYGLNFQEGQMMPPKVSNYDRQQPQPKPKENVPTYHMKIQTEPSSGPKTPNRYEFQERHPSDSGSQNLMALQQGPQSLNPRVNGIPMVNSIDRQPKQIQQDNLGDYQDREQQYYHVVNESLQPITSGQPNVYHTHREAQQQPSHYHSDSKHDYTKHKYPQDYEVYDNASPKEITINLPPYGQTGTSQDYIHGHGEQNNLEQYQVVHEGPAAHVVAVPSSAGTTSVVYPVHGYQHDYSYSNAGGDSNSGSRQPYRQAQNKAYNPYEPSYIQGSHEPNAQYDYTVRRP